MVRLRFVYVCRSIQRLSYSNPLPIPVATITLPSFRAHGIALKASSDFEFFQQCMVNDLNNFRWPGNMNDGDESDQDEVGEELHCSRFEDQFVTKRRFLVSVGFANKAQTLRVRARQFPK